MWYMKCFKFIGIGFNVNRIITKSFKYFGVLSVQWENVVVTLIAIPSP